jgi:hypothetical protein
VVSKSLCREFKRSDTWRGNLFGLSEISLSRITYTVDKNRESPLFIAHASELTDRRKQMPLPIRFHRAILSFATLFTVLFCALAVDAQTQKGSVMIAGSASFSSSSGDLYGDEALTQLQLLPAIYYFAADHVAIGGRVNYINVSQGDASSSALLLGPYAAYFFQAGAKSSPFVGGGIFLNSNSASVGDHSITSSGQTIALGAGIAFFVKPHFAITPELGVNFQSLESVSGTTILLGVGLAGFVYK